METDDKRWWDVIAVGCPHDVDPGDWNDTLANELAKLPADDVLRFDVWFDNQTDRAHRRDLWQVADHINGGASDDGFFYFRCWLLGMGKAVFEGALENPDSLAEVIDPHNMEYEAEIYGVARDAWFAVTGKDQDKDEDEYFAAKSALETRQRPIDQGDEIDDESNSAFQRRYPRLAALLFTEDDYEGEAE